MKKILVKPGYIVALILIVLALVAGGVYLVHRNAGPKLSPEEKALQEAQRKIQEKVEPLETCLTKAKNSDAQQSVIKEEMDKCRQKYADL